MWATIFKSRHRAAGLTIENDGLTANRTPEGRAFDLVIPCHRVPVILQKHQPSRISNKAFGFLCAPLCTLWFKIFVLQSGVEWIASYGQEVDADRRQLRRRKLRLESRVGFQSGFFDRIQKDR